MLALGGLGLTGLSSILQPPVDKAESRMVTQVFVDVQDSAVSFFVVSTTRALHRRARLRGRTPQHNHGGSREQQPQP